MSGDPFDNFDDNMDGCEVDMLEGAVSDEEADLFVLFADALDSNTPSTVEERKREWDELLK